MDTPVHALVGGVVRGAREDAGLSLRAVAEKAGISAAYLGEIERGVKEPSSAVLATIAAALNMALSDIYYAVALELRKRELLAARRAAFATPPPPAPVRAASFGFRATPPQPVQPRNLLSPDFSAAAPGLTPLPVPQIMDYHMADDTQAAHDAAADLPPLPRTETDLPPAATTEAEVRRLLSAFGDFLLSRTQSD